ncbi:MAG TPA: high light inducible protein [Cyanobacteria bacterium UBA11149]|nr:high light inducible protein [Cyanobacteria bacterium UBA11367]HBE56870.1 high light inducible protein [Cyanobacteria bacterium UBA11366]HBK63110.1 high light inducible protein [Cyanobacteria bacterium UBA11166]HBR73802.1 high light inducible protein [Cyanobacteria bacterium UBA11159]HBS67596.1 high light inducible protein [Cyanobacteria bacterium UBA11153]HBW88714.1 high light inducible protein [Cyanobacteria bacterium UBA11149]HCA93743.1 high light inducible protein [Cyanobacteria bacter
MNSRGYILDEQKKLNNFAIEPQIYVDETLQTGFTEYAEKINGRLAMIGFISLLAIEVITKEGLIQWLANL